MKKLMMVAMLALGGCVVWENGSETTKYVDEFDLAPASAGMGKKVTALKTVDGNGFVLSGKAYARGFGTHPESAVTFVSNGKVTAFDALVGSRLSFVRKPE